MYTYKYASQQRKVWEGTHTHGPSLSPLGGLRRERSVAKGTYALITVSEFGNAFQIRYNLSIFFKKGEKIKQTLTAFIDLFQLIHRRKGEKFITGLTTNS